MNDFVKKNALQSIPLFEKIKKQDPYVFFTISKTSNKNVVVYTQNLTPKGSPVYPYWIMYEKDEGGKVVENLNIIEKKFAYGIGPLNSFLTQNDELVYSFSLNGFPSLVLECNSETNECIVTMDDEKITVKEIDIQVTGNLFYNVMSARIKGFCKNGYPITRGVNP